MTQPPGGTALAALDLSVRDSGLALCVLEHGNVRAYRGRAVPAALRTFLDGAGARLLGVDAPLGVPATWAERAEIGSFRELVCGLSEDVLAALLEPARAPAQVHAMRPFLVPPRGVRLRDLAARLGLAPEELPRRCDQLARAHPLFWCVGPRQVGRAAARFWREVLRPRWCLGALAVWPFDGTLEALLRRARPVVLELYPTLVRRSFAFHVERAALLLGGERAERLAAVAAHGAKRTDADDAAFALVQLHAFLVDPREPPPDPAVLSLEGWIAGLEAGAGG